MTFRVVLLERSHTALPASPNSVTTRESYLGSQFYKLVIFESPSSVYCNSEKLLQTKDKVSFCLKFVFAKSPNLFLLKVLTGGPRKLLYQGPAESFRDRDSQLLPFTEYEYLVSAFNSEGYVSSEWERVRTKEAPPFGVPPPVVKVRSHLRFWFFLSRFLCSDDQWTSWASTVWKRLILLKSGWLMTHL